MQRLFFSPCLLLVARHVAFESVKLVHLLFELQLIVDRRVIVVPDVLKFLILVIKLLRHVVHVDLGSDNLF